MATFTAHDLELLTRAHFATSNGRDNQWERIQGERATLITRRSDYWAEAGHPQWSAYTFAGARHVSAHMAHTLAELLTALQGDV